jgi:site-specific recombinase XerD
MSQEQPSTATSRPRLHKKYPKPLVYIIFCQKCFATGLKTTTQSIALFRETLQGKNYSSQSIKAYLSDLAQFVQWLKSRRVDWDIPYRIERIDIVEFINHLAQQKALAIRRQRKLAAIRGFLKFCKDNQII